MEMVGGINAGITARQVNKMDDAGVLAVSTPKLRLAGEQIGVEVEAFASGDVRGAHELRVKPTISESATRGATWTDSISGLSQKLTDTLS